MLKNAKAEPAREYPDSLPCVKSTYINIAKCHFERSSYKWVGGQQTHALRDSVACVVQRLLGPLLKQIIYVMFAELSVCQANIWSTTQHASANNLVTLAETQLTF